MERKVPYRKRERKRTSIPTLFRFPAFMKLQHEQSENNGYFIISEK